MNRAERRQVRRVLHKGRCGSCGLATLDEQAHEATLVGPRGEEFAHLICRSCFQEALSGLDGQRAVATRARLALAPAEGAA